jgi:hypothetical protein
MTHRRWVIVELRDHGVPKINHHIVVQTRQRSAAGTRPFKVDGHALPVRDLSATYRRRGPVQ